MASVEPLDLKPHPPRKKSVQLHTASFRRGEEKARKKLKGTECKFYQLNPCIKQYITTDIYLLTAFKNLITK